MSPLILILTFFAISGLTAASVRIVRHIAVKKAILDQPNERSSHKVPVPRLGGAGFVPVLLLAAAIGWGDTNPTLRVAYLSGAGLLFVISLLDDFLSLSTGVRFAVQFAAAGIVLWAVNSIHILGVPGLNQAVLCLMAVGIVGLLNIYNFMDGIDGIAGVQAIAAAGGWLVIALISGAPCATWLSLVVGAAAAGFLTLNWPPARIFMGDAGSTVLGYTFAVLPLLVWVEAESRVPGPLLFAAAFLLVWPFLADGVFTIVRRIFRRENILKAHRSHLYQRLVITGKSHREVALIYGSLAVVGALLAGSLLAGIKHALPAAAVTIFLLFIGLWFWTCRSERVAVRKHS